MTLVWIAIGLLVLWIVTLEGRILAAFNRLAGQIEELRELMNEGEDDEDEEE
jgi:hypothetical protein